MSNLLPKPPQDPPEHPFGTSDPSTSLRNLSAVRTRMESLQKFLSESVNSNTLITPHQMDMVSSEITSAIHQIILNGAALLSPAQPQPQSPTPPATTTGITKECESESSDYEVVEIDAVELLAEHIHFCEICGKGFKRDANLRMHMRAHGNEFKTPEALAKPDKGKGKDEVEETRKRRFSCPYQGCNRNKNHRKFRALKSVICVKNHFKRSHCPKMYTCDRCHKKSFSVLSDLKSHYKHCGESRWKCSCGTSFSRKDKLFGHLALFEGHMPQPHPEVESIKEDEEDEEDIDEDQDQVHVQDKKRNGNLVEDAALFQSLLDDFDFGSIQNYCLHDVLGPA